MSVYQWTMLRVAKEGKNDLLKYLKDIDADTEAMTFAEMPDGSIVVDLETFHGGDHVELEDFAASTKHPVMIATGSEDYWVDLSKGLPTWNGWILPQNDDAEAAYYPCDKQWTMSMFPRLTQTGKAIDPFKETEEVRDNRDLEMVCRIIEVFEDYLDEKGIVIDNPEKAEAVADGCDPEGISNIYGCEFGDLESQITWILQQYGVIEKKN